MSQTNRIFPIKIIVCVLSKLDANAHPHKKALVTEGIAILSSVCLRSLDLAIFEGKIW